MMVGSLRTRGPEERRMLFENPRLETLPVDNPAVGQIPVFVRREILEALAERVRTSGAGGGLILGSPWIGNGVEFVEIEGFASGACSSMPAVPAEWQSVLEDLPPGEPDTPALGWWLARGGDLSLTRADRSFHRSYFPLPWTLALLVNPSDGAMRIHQWTQGNLEECGYFIVSRLRT